MVFGGVGDVHFGSSGYPFCIAVLLSLARAPVWSARPIYDHVSRSASRKKIALTHRIEDTIYGVGRSRGALEPHDMHFRTYNDDNRPGAGAR